MGSESPYSSRQNRFPIEANMPLEDEVLCAALFEMEKAGQGGKT